jgi:hypothetical protein
VRNRVEACLDDAPLLLPLAQDQEHIVRGDVHIH